MFNQTSICLFFYQFLLFTNLSFYSKIHIYEYFNLFKFKMNILFYNSTVYNIDNYFISKLLQTACII